MLDRSAAPILNKTEAAYQRGDLLAKRRRMMEAWAGFCEALDEHFVAVTPGTDEHRRGTAH